MTGRCEETRARLRDYLEETLSREERSAVRGHLADCAACRRDASHLDPALLFAAVAPERVSAEDAARILDGVRSGISLKTAERRVRRSSSHAHGRRAGAMAAAAAAAVLIALTLSSPSPARLRAAGGAVEPSERGSSGSERAGAGAGEAPAITAGAPAMADRPLSPFAEASAPGGQKVPADATIYDWNPGGGQPRVVWIVDRSLDI